MVFNGEIYNHADLRPAASGTWSSLQSRCDTETILHLYEEYGERAPEHLHGMFAFAIWDAPKQQLLLARDRLGIKPLYFSCTGTELVFGSEIKAILAASSTAPPINESALPDYLSTGFVSGEQTLFRGITRLLPGHVLTWSADDGMQQRRYWQLPAPAERAPRSFAAEADSLRTRLNGAVKSHLMSDVPLGVFLSGGLDSSALAAIAARSSPPRLRTFAVGFADPRGQRARLCEARGQRDRSRHREVVVTPEQFFEALPHLIWHEDEPIAFPSSVPLYFLSRLARDHVKVVLTGEGADELFLGYNRYRVTNWNARLGRPYWALMPGAVRRGSPACRATRCPAVRPRRPAHVPRSRLRVAQSVSRKLRGGP